MLDSARHQIVQKLREYVISVISVDSHGALVRSQPACCLAADQSRSSHLDCSYPDGTDMESEMCFAKADVQQDAGCPAGVPRG